MPEFSVLLSEWDKPGNPFKGFAAAYVRKHQWRVLYLLGGDIEDAMAECELFWVQVCKFYPAITEPASMMHMYKLWISGQFNDYSTKDTRSRNTMEVLSRGDLSINSEGDLAVKLDEASSDLKQVLNIFMNAPQEIIDVIKQDTKGWTTKLFIKKILMHLNLNPKKTDSIINELKEILS
jgi:hypothetical protein